MSLYSPGSPVVVRGQGVGSVISSDAVGTVVRLSDGEVRVRAADVAEFLRPVIGRSEAREFLRRLCESGLEGRTLPELRSLRELERAPLERQIEYSRMYFRQRKILGVKEPDIIVVVSENVLGEIAIALGADVDDVRASVKRGNPDVISREPRRLPAAPTLEGCSHVRSFHATGSIIFSERPERVLSERPPGAGESFVVMECEDDVLVASVAIGVWFAYLCETEGSDASPRKVPLEEARATMPATSTKRASREFDGLLLVHESEKVHVDRIAEATHELGSVNLEGGRIGILDASALDDPEFGVEGVERTRRDGDGFADRGLEVPTFGDGAHRIFANNSASATVLLIEF